MVEFIKLSDVRIFDEYKRVLLHAVSKLHVVFSENQKGENNE